MTGFSFGKQSRLKQVGVHPVLVAVSNLAITLSDVDFSINEGVRTYSTQKHYVAIGTSTTMDSMHLPQKDGLSHALDNVPYINGTLRWDWELLYHVASAYRRAGDKIGVSSKLIWGGVWDKRISEYDCLTFEGARAAEEDYVNRRKAGGKRVFVDGPHIEIHP